MSIQDRIKGMSQYFRSMNVAPDNEGKFVTYVEVVFPSTWVIIETTRENFNVDFAPAEGQGAYYFWSNADDAQEKIFDALEANIKVNKDAEEKVKFLMAKIDELKSIFSESDMTLETLKTLEFKFSKTKASKLPSAIKAKVEEQEDIAETAEKE